MNQKGFSLLELLVVVAIIGLLASIALPSYQSYLKKTRFTEVILATAAYKTAVTVALHSGEALNQLHSGANGIPSAATQSKNIQSISVSDGVITAIASQAAGAYSYILTPDASGNHWQVSGSCLAAGFCKQ